MRKHSSGTQQRFLFRHPYYYQKNVQIIPLLFVFVGFFLFQQCVLVILPHNLQQQQVQYNHHHENNNHNHSNNNVVFVHGFTGMNHNKYGTIHRRSRHHHHDSTVVVRSRIEQQQQLLLPKEDYKYLLPQQSRKISRRQFDPTTTMTTLFSSVTTSDDDNNNNNSNNNNHQMDVPVSAVPIWPCGDELDKRLIKIVIPIMLNNAITPLMGMIDYLWVSRMGNPLTIAGQASANQIMNSIFWLITFLPVVSATLVSKENATGNTDGIELAICQALLIGIVLALIPTIFILWNPNYFLSTVLPNSNSPAFVYAKQCLYIRSLSFLPSIVSLVGFAAFRGTMDTITPVKISLFANVFNAVLDPIFIFTFGLGVRGAALATLLSEIISAITYLYFLRKRQLIRTISKIFRIPQWNKLQPLIKGGLALQLRNVALNITFLSVARVTNAIDLSGIAAAAHALTIQIFQLGGVALFALSIATQTIIPNDMIEKIDAKTNVKTGGIQVAKKTLNRLMSWGFLLGTSFGLLQFLLLPIIKKSTPVQEVRDAVTIPALLCSIYQIMNGLVFIGEGAMTGTGSFLQLSFYTIVSTIGCLWALQTFAPIYGLTGVWIGFGVFNIMRLMGVYIHQTISGPLAPRRYNKGNKTA